MNAHHTPNASVEKIEGGFRLAIHSSKKRGYQDAQLDDYSGRSRRDFPHHALSMSLSARVSDCSLPGTWGFGLWNDPFGLSLGFGGQPFRLPALPNSTWFFHASKENCLSFRDDKPPHGFLAQVFRSPPFHPRLFPAGLTFPFSPKSTRRALGGIIGEDSTLLDVDVTAWHRYRLDWSPAECFFWVDDMPVLHTPISPRPPLGLIIWIDNQYACFSADGKIQFGVLESPGAWLDIVHLELK